ncbi:MAG: glycoside hydrolase family 32 protein [Bryobacteraceae bacterium]|jgi:sucrose-6-phosphate hydrolase SacC (GH32 family)
MNRRQFSRLAAVAAVRAVSASRQQPPYREEYRPQFHFSAKTGWINDPNGLVYYKGEYHLFFQHNPFGLEWGNMTWGHAVSPDMVHWTQIENALQPDRMGTMFSGSAVVDHDNRAGFQKGEDKTIVLIYTAAGGTNPESKGQPYTQCLAYSNDRGRSWTKYAGNPVVPNIAGGNRDPRVVWHEGTRQWIMALYLEGSTYGFLASSNLRKWTILQQISVPGVGECPDFFEMPVENEPGVTRWVWTGADANYLVGSFDGRRFIPEVMTQPLSHGANYYAVQTFSDLPRNRRVQMSWMKDGRYPGMPFNQQMSCPYELRLRRYGYNSYRLLALPIHEIEALREMPRSWKDLEVKPLEDPLAGITGDLWDIRAEIAPGAAKEVGFKVRGWTVVYTAKETPRDNVLSSGRFGSEMPPRDGRVKIRILVDRTSVETFGNDGEVVIPACFLPQANDRSLELFATGGAAKVLSLDVYPLRPAWSTE